MVTTGAVALVISSIFLVLRSVGFLREAADGHIAVDSVLILVLLKMVTYMDIILPLILFVAILMVLGRWHRDNEMTVIAACGIGLQSLLKPMIVVFLVVGGLVATFSLYLAPLATRVALNITHEYKARSEITGVATGSFIETRRGSGVYFVEDYNEARDVYEHVFVHNSSFDSEGVVVADTARRTTDQRTGAQFLVLENGTRYEGTAGAPDYRVIEFARYAIRLKEKASTSPSIPIKGWPTLQIMNAKNPRLVTEWHWRLAKPVSLGVLILFALAFSANEVRNRRVVNLLLAFLVYFAYFNALGLVVVWMQKGDLGASAGLWVVHGIFALIAIWLFLCRCQGKRFYEFPRLLPRRTGAVDRLADDAAAAR